MLRTIRSLLTAVAVTAVPAFAAEGPPVTATGAIGNEKLTANQDVANAQAVGVITQFMSNGAKTCDENGQNCRSLFGADDNLDYATLQMNTQSVTGIDSFSFMDEDNNTSSVSAQTASLVLVCGDTKAKTIAGIAVKASSCSVAANGSVSLTYQVCTGPSRGNPIEQADNAVLCSTDPAAPNFRPPDGMVCLRAACDSEPVGSLNGWSAPQTVTWNATLPSSATEDERAKNGLGLTFYPPLNGTVPPSYTADSDNMSAVKVVQSFRNSSTNQTAVGLKVAYRHKAKVTKEMMTSGAAAVPNPGAHTAQWDTLLKLQGNALIPEYQAKYAKNGTECLQQIQSGIASDGVISVCDQEYVNESGIRPIERTAQVGAEGQECSTTEQCLREVVNTNTWTQTCRSDVPLAVRNCTTTTAYTTVDIHATRTRSQEICREKRSSSVYSCNTSSYITQCANVSTFNQGGMDVTAGSSDVSLALVGMVDPMTANYRFGTVGDNYWKGGYYKREFSIYVHDINDVKRFYLYRVQYDDLTALSLNGTWVYSEWGGGYYNSALDQWGKDFQSCTYDYETGEQTCTSTFRVRWERDTNWNRSVGVDLRPYLREGHNVLRMDTGVVGLGEGWFFFEISAYKQVCEFGTTNECTNYEAAR